MSSVPERFASPIVDADVTDTLREVTSALSRDQLLWSSGYLAGLAESKHRSEPHALLAPASPPAESKWRVFYASETGNCRRIAHDLGKQLEEAGTSAEILDLQDYEPKALRRVEHAVFVVATHGLGDAPEGTEHFFDYWMGERAPAVEQLSYSVLALGDSSYEEFCGFGRAFDDRLAKLGARRIHERVDCDVDFDTDALAWRTAVVAAVATQAKPLLTLASSGVQPRAAASRFSRDNPFLAELIVNQKITGRESSKDVRHIELSLDGSGLDYMPGDALGIWPDNPPELVTQLIELTGLDGDAPVEIRGEPTSLHDALLRRLEITKLSRGFVEAYAGLVNSAPLRQCLADSDRLRTLLATHQVVDIVAAHPGPLEAAGFVTALRGLTPRLYSIASSGEANPDEVHLTVSIVDYERFGRRHCGAASAFLRGNIGQAPVYVEPNDRFRLPLDGDTPIVMIGAGTGIAPFRAYVQHRRTIGARGHNWLIYGDRTMRADFLYQIEWLRSLKDGSLARLDVAFSRDQSQKFYVQDRIRQCGPEIYDWLERGAHVFVCGDADNMAPAVEMALLDAIAKAANMSAEAARAYVQALKSEKRYKKDVY